MMPIGINPAAPPPPWTGLPRPAVDQLPADTFVRSAPSSEAREKDRLIRSMIRRAPDEASKADVVEALSAYPVRALQIVQGYGTAIEIYDFKAGEAVPEYLPTLAYGHVAGAYNTRANVLGTDRGNASAFALIHEFAHALDAAMHDVSSRPKWRNAHAFASHTNRVVRDYAKQDSSEFLAEATCAYLIPDEQLLPLVEKGLARGAHGLDEREFMRMHQNLSNGSLQRVDRDTYNLVDELLTKDIYEDPVKAPLPAMSEEEWHAFEEARRKAQAS